MFTRHLGGRVQQEEVIELSATRSIFCFTILIYLATSSIIISYTIPNNRFLNNGEKHSVICTGKFNRKAKTHEERLVVYTELEGLDEEG